MDYDVELSFAFICACTSRYLCAIVSLFIIAITSSLHEICILLPSVVLTFHIALIVL